MPKLTLLINKQLLIKAITLVMLLWFTGATAEIRIQTSKTSIELGETIEITISSDKGKNFDLNQLQPLLQYFNVLGQSQSQQYQNINGKQSNSFSLNLRLSAKKQGIFNIPAMLINGEQSRSFTLTVNTNSAVKPAGGTTKNFDVIGFVDTPETYVGAEVIYTFKLLYKNRIIRGQISQPKIPRVQVKTIVKQKRSQTVRNGQSYEVLERRYTFIPTRSETLKIAPLFFEGTVLVPSGQKRIRINTEEVNVVVKPIPVNWPANKDWLPAKSLSLWEKWQPSANQWQVGTPVSRSIEIEALGIDPSQIGNIEIGKPAFVNTYPQQPIRNLKLNPHGHQAKVTFNVDYIATSATTLTLPEIKISWWDVKTKHLRYASLPAKQIQVREVSQVTSNSFDNNSPILTPVVTQQTTSNKVGLSNQSLSLQPLKLWAQNKVVLIFFAIFLLLYTLVTILLTTIYQRYRQNKLNKRNNTPDPSQHYQLLSQQLQKSYKNQDFQQLKHLLLISYRQYQYQFSKDIKQQWQDQIHQLSIDNFMTKEYLDELINHLKVTEKSVKKIRGALPKLYPN